MSKKKFNQLLVIKNYSDIEETIIKLLKDQTEYHVEMPTELMKYSDLYKAIYKTGKFKIVTKKIKFETVEFRIR